MRETLQPGIRHSFRFTVPNDKLVPALYPEAPEFQAMPKVFASGYLIGLIEWVCIQAVNPHIDWPREQSVGTHFDLSHAAPTPAGCPVEVEVELIEVEKRRVKFRVSARDDVGTISEGTHERFVVDAERFGAALKQRSAGDS